MTRRWLTRVALLLIATVATGGEAPLYAADPGPSNAVALDPGHGRKPLYFQDPDGRPFYAAAPKTTPDGRAYVPVFVEPASPPASPKPPAAATAADRGRVLYYRNPMGLPDTSPTPKKDPMGMDYIPVYANEAADAEAGIVSVSPTRIQELGVRTAPVETRSALTRTVRATGTVEFDERRLAVATTRADGWITHLAVTATGDPVRRGETLAEIYAPDLAASEQEYLVAANLAGSAGSADTRLAGDAGMRSLAAAALERLAALGVPPDEIERLRRTRRVARTIAVRAPEDGVVIDKPAIEGMRVSRDQALFKTASLDPIWLIAEVAEQDIGEVRRGESARADLVAFPGRSFAGTVDFIYPSLTATTRTARVRIIMPNADSALRAGMFATVEIAVPSGAAGPVVAVPSSAIIDSGTRQVVLVALGGGRFAPRQVRVGAQGGDYSQILDGVRPGEQVVVGANFLIDSESNLRSALQSFTKGSSQPSAQKATR